MPRPRLPGVLLGLVAAAIVFVPLPAQRSDAALPERPRPAIVSASTLGGSAMQADGAARTELPWLLAGDGDPVISPDGRHLAFSSARNGNREIYVADATTGELRRLTASRGVVDQKPAWSPDGRRIAWQAGARGRPADVWVMRADGGKKRLLAGGPSHDIDPAWSPDGTRIAFASNRSGGFDLWSSREGGRRAGAAARRPRRRTGAGVEPGRNTRRLQRGERRRHEHLDPARRHARDDPRHPLPGGGPAPGLVARREAPGLRPLRSRPLAHLGHPGERRHRAARRRYRGGHRPRLGERGAGARARPPRAPARPRPACARRPRRDRERGRVLPRIHVCGGQPRSGSAPDPRLAVAWDGPDAGRPGDRAPGWRNARRSRRGHTALPDASAPPALALPGIRELRAPPGGRPRDRRA